MEEDEAENGQIYEARAVRDTPVQASLPRYLPYLPHITYAGGWVPFMSAYKDQREASYLFWLVPLSAVSNVSKMSSWGSSANQSLARKRNAVGFLLRSVLRRSTKEQDAGGRMEPVLLTAWHMDRMPHDRLVIVYFVIRPT